MSSFSISAAQELSQLYREWYRLSSGEAAAIAAADWNALARCHSAKTSLHPRLVSATQRRRAELSRIGLLQDDGARVFDEIIEDLLLLETHNQDLYIARMRELQRSEKPTEPIPMVTWPRFPAPTESGREPGS